MCTINEWLQTASKTEIVAAEAVVTCLLQDDNGWEFLQSASSEIIAGAIQLLTIMAESAPASKHAVYCFQAAGALDALNKNKQQ